MAGIVPQLGPAWGVGSAPADEASPIGGSGTWRVATCAGTTHRPGPPVGASRADRRTEGQATLPVRAVDPPSRGRVSCPSARPWLRGWSGSPAAGSPGSSRRSGRPLPRCPSPNASGSMRTTRSNSRPFDSSGVSDRTRDVARNAPGRADDAGDPVGVRGEPGVEDRAQVRGGSVHDGDAAAADGGRHVGVREHGPDDRLGLGHDLLRRPVVDAQRGERRPGRARPARAVPATTR